MSRARSRNSETKTLKANRLGLSWTDKGSKSSLTAMRRFEKHEFQANYDRRSIHKLNETIESQQEEFHRAQAEERRRQDHQLLHEQLLKQNWDLRAAHGKSLDEMEELKRFPGSTIRNNCKKKIGRRSRYVTPQLRIGVRGPFFFSSFFFHFSSFLTFFHFHFSSFFYIFLFFFPHFFSFFHFFHFSFFSFFFQFFPLLGLPRPLPKHRFLSRKS